MALILAVVVLLHLILSLVRLCLLKPKRKPLKLLDLDKIDGVADADASNTTMREGEGVAVSGGSGFIGSAILSALVLKGYKDIRSFDVRPPSEGRRVEGVVRDDGDLARRPELREDRPRAALGELLAHPREEALAHALRVCG